MFWRGRHKFANIELIPGGESLGLMNYQNGGRIYYVNNISGNSGNDGLSWRKPFAQVSEAIAASETFRELGGRAPTVTTNDYVANTILIQATGTVYTGITDLGERCYIIGQSAGLNRCGGSGTVRIGADDTDGLDQASGHCRGNTLYNMMFVGGGNNNYAFRVPDTQWIQRSRFQDVDFNQGGADLEACFYVGVISGSIFERCSFENQQGGTAVLYGMYFAGQCSNVIVTDCLFSAGSTALLYMASANQVNTVIGPDNMFCGVSAVGAANALSTVAGHAFLAGNFFLDKNASALTDQIDWGQAYMLAGNYDASGIVHNTT